MFIFIKFKQLYSLHYEISPIQIIELKLKINLLPNISY